MAVDPSIALSGRAIEVQSPLNSFAQASQIQAYQRQNELANRAVEQEDALNRAYASSIGQNGEVDPTLLRQNLIGAQLGSKLPAVETTLLNARKAKAEVGKAEFELSNAQKEDSMRQIASYDSREDALRHIQSDYEAKKITQQQAQQFAKMIPDNDADMPKFQVLMLRGMLKPQERLEQQFTSQDYAGGTRVIATPKYAGGGPAQVVQGSDIKKTATIADQLAERKFTWEKANPGFELKESEDGSTYGVNKRTLEAFPVMMGGAAPTGGSPRVPTNNLAQTPANVNNLAQPNAQVIPGMNSVLDQRAPVAPVTPQALQAGTPLKGKAPSLTETQSNATAYGMRMKEANAILEDLAKKGVVKGAVIERTPLIGGVLGQTLPGFLGGTNEAQQQVNQAKSNFITAVLRKESGAVISDSEFEREDKKYFPQINDSEKVIKQKENARKLAIDTIAIQAGPGAKNIKNLQPSVGNSETDPLGLLGR